MLDIIQEIPGGYEYQGPLGERSIQRIPDYVNHGRLRLRTFDIIAYYHDYIKKLHPELSWWKKKGKDQFQPKLVFDIQKFKHPYMGDKEYGRGTYKVWWQNVCVYEFRYDADFLQQSKFLIYINNLQFPLDWLDNVPIYQHHRKEIYPYSPVVASIV